MMSFELVPVLVTGGGGKAAAPEKRPRTFADTLNELMVIVFFSLGPALGAAIFFLWFGGLVWGLVSSFFR
ncbi:MAG TPA: hypothetical protein VFC10_02865 [Terriglobia bacterium]|jgi:hypothetical protein|nr:hypothetical protein [Terriglobia bacterium]